MIEELQGADGVWCIVDDTVHPDGPNPGGGLVVCRLWPGSSALRIWEHKAHCPTLESAEAALRLLDEPAYWEYLEMENAGGYFG